jgi:hypothetical protein
MPISNPEIWNSFLANIYFYIVTILVAITYFYYKKVKYLFSIKVKHSSFGKNSIGGLSLSVDIKNDSEKIIRIKNFILLQNEIEVGYSGLEHLPKDIVPGFELVNKSLWLEEIFANKLDKTKKEFTLKVIGINEKVLAEDKFLCFNT